MTKVSVVVPVYNAERYIDRCMDSLVNQTLDDIEFIIINDGSTDNSEKIIKKYDSPKIKYFKRTNHGIGNTRNFGIRQASGDYIGFVDSDDYIEKNMYEKLYNKAISDKLDLVVCDFFRDFEDTNTFIVEHISGLENEYTNLKKSPEVLNEVNLSPWNKLYKRELIDADMENFPEKLKYEDVPFVVRMLDKASRIGKLDLPLYHYMIHKNSETTIMDKRVFDIFGILDIILKENGGKEYLKEELENLLVTTLTNYNIQQRYQKDKKLREQFINMSFEYLNKNCTNFKSSSYYKRHNIFRRELEKSIYLTKLYCNLYAWLKYRK